MDTQGLGRMLIGVGVFAIALGLFFLFKDKVPGLNRLGRLPGDIAYENENVKFYFPLVTSLLLSAILSLLVWLFKGRG
jgi:hypothetical protein